MKRDTTARRIFRRDLRVAPARGVNSQCSPAPDRAAWDISFRGASGLIEIDAEYLYGSEAELEGPRVMY